MFTIFLAELPLHKKIALYASRSSG